jgi:hypothetical protein
MTEADWLACREPARMMRFIRHSAGGGSAFTPWFGPAVYGTLTRKWRLFLSACCRRVWPALGDGGPAQQLVEFAEGFTDSPPTEQAYRTVCEWFGRHPQWSSRQVRLVQALTSNLGAAASVLRTIIGTHARSETPVKADKPAAERMALGAESVAQCHLLRDLFGNPFREAKWVAAWRTPPLLSLAQAAYDERVLPSGTFDLPRLAVLSDALEESGCADEAVLNHLRSPAPHVRGCWVIDLLLGKS